MISKAKGFFLLESRIMKFRSHSSLPLSKVV